MKCRPLCAACHRISVAGKLIQPHTTPPWYCSPAHAAGQREEHADGHPDLSLVLVGLGITLLGTDADRGYALVALDHQKCRNLKDANTELMDGGAEHQLYVAVFAAVACTRGYESTQMQD